MAPRYTFAGWVDFVIEIRHATTPEQWRSFRDELAADVFLINSVTVLPTSGRSPSPGAMVEEQIDETHYLRVSCPASELKSVLISLDQHLERQLPPSQED